MMRLARGIITILLGSSLCSAAQEYHRSGAALRGVASFDHIADPKQRSQALFAEAAKVITHPRCLNCHPATRSPTQGDDFHPHRPLVTGGAAGHGAGVVGCKSCHRDRNIAVAGSGGRSSVPGNAHWALAPASMAWQHRSVAGICRQIKDRRRNGNRSLDQIVHHMSSDSLVGWAWVPGDGRNPAPGTHALFGELIGAWARTGAECPR